MISETITIESIGKNLTAGSLTNFINASNNAVHISAVASENENPYLDIKTNFNTTKTKLKIVMIMLNINATLKTPFLKDSFFAFSTLKYSSILVIISFESTTLSVFPISMF